MRQLLVIIFVIAGFAGCARNERDITEAERVLTAHFDALRAGDTNGLLGRYSPEFFRQSKRNREQWAQSLARLHSKGLRDYAIVHRELSSSGDNLLVRLSCRSRYGADSFEEDFELSRAAGSTNFVITVHDFD